MNERQLRFTNLGVKLLASFVAKLTLAQLLAPTQTTPKTYCMYI